MLIQLHRARMSIYSVWWGELDSNQHRNGYRQGYNLRPSPIGESPRKLSLRRDNSTMVKVAAQSWVSRILSLLVARKGIEPLASDHESEVLPLHHRAATV